MACREIWVGGRVLKYRVSVASSKIKPRFHPTFAVQCLSFSYVFGSNMKERPGTISEFSQV